MCWCSIILGDQIFGTLRYHWRIKTDQHCRIFKHELHQLVAQNPGHLIFQMKTLNNLVTLRNDTHLEYNLEDVPILMLILILILVLVLILILLSPDI